eukprot:TRINITY_DN11955_c0_g1_i7.p1 TRINITY_DN11955_c0_g1~~TRINITY_DN11955_c0_g1_i7.p1  ORF type:complete len:137 (-),score=1.20 TRINITY_DN11955_c0_g1_i7:280-690(-)
MRLVAMAIRVRRVWLRLQGFQGRLRTPRIAKLRIAERPCSKFSFFGSYDSERPLPKCRVKEKAKRYLGIPNVDKSHSVSNASKRLKLATPSESVRKHALPTIGYLSICNFPFSPKVLRIITLIEKQCTLSTIPTNE